jgi:NAD(P)-dependent dehydrogenase (short-subunit alcohol dehydrogenase family)
MSNNIEGKVVVITGASSGLGEATARLLSAQGASVVLGARRVDRPHAPGAVGVVRARGGSYSKTEQGVQVNGRVIMNTHAGLYGWHAAQTRDEFDDMSAFVRNFPNGIAAW